METESNGKVEDIVQEKLQNGEEERREELLRIIPFSIHDWDQHFRLAMLESEADRLQREYEALEAIHEYSKRIEVLKEQMENEGLNSQEENFEVETESETFQDVDIADELNSLNEESCGNLGSKLSENSLGREAANVEISESDAEFSAEISEEIAGTSGSSSFDSSSGNP